MLKLALALTLLAPGALAAEAPDWVVKGSYKEGPRLVAVGAGATLHGALLEALTQTAGLLGSKGDEYERAFGPLTLKHKVTGTSSVPTKPGDKEFAKSVTEARLQRGRKHIRIVASVLSENLPDNRSRERVELTLEAEELGLSDVLSILADQGYAFKDWRDPADFTQFVALERGGGK